MESDWFHELARFDRRFLDFPFDGHLSTIRRHLTMCRRYRRRPLRHKRSRGHGLPMQGNLGPVRPAAAVKG
jgi:hypothetical protein